MRFLRPLKNIKGFTLIELMIVVTIIGILATIAVPNYKMGIIKAREAVLRENLYSIRTSIDQYYADHGKYPDGVRAMFEKKYLRAIPIDPFTGKSDWVENSPEPKSDGSTDEGFLGDVHSASTLIGTNGTAYNEW